MSLSQIVVAIRHRHAITVGLLDELSNPWHEEIRSPWGQVISPDTLHADHVRKVQRFQRSPGFGIQADSRLPKLDAPKGELPIFFGRIKAIEVGGNGEDVAGVDVALPVLLAPKDPYAVCMTGIPIDTVDLSRGFHAFLARVRDILDADLVFADLAMPFTEPGLVDPLARAWSLAYYGPSLVSELGRDRLATAPAHKVEFDERGGCWVWLDALPFAPSPQKEARRAAVEAHLGLRERFPNE